MLKDRTGNVAASVAELEKLTQRKVVEQKLKTEETLKTSEEWFRALIENASDAVAILDDKGMILYESPSAERILGRKPEQLEGTTFPDLIHPDDMPQAISLFESVLENPGKIIGCQLKLKHKDGSWRTVEAKAQNLLHDPKIGGIVVNYHDITERKKAEEAIRESELRYRLLAENASDVITVMDMNMRPVYMSPSVTRLLGYSVEEAMAHGMEEGLTPASLKSAAEAFATIMAEEQKGQKQKPVTMDLEFRRKDGSTVWVANSVSFIRNSDGQAVEILSNMHDITERKKVEDATRRAAQHWRTTFDSINDLVSIHDRDFRIVRVNRSLSNLLKMEPKEVIGRRCYELLHGSSEPCSDCPSVRTMKTKMPATLESFHDGFGIHLETTTSPIFNEIGEVTECVHIARDISARRKVEETQRESEKRYRLLAENLSDVIWTMDTNLRYTYMSPSVTSLRGYSVEEAMALSMEETTTPASLQTAMRVMAEAEAKEGVGSNSQPSSVTLELELTCKDGSTIWVENRITYLRDAEGRLTGYQGVSRDISERKKAEVALHALSSRQQALLTAIPDIIVEVDKNKVFTWTNSAGLEFYGEDVLGKEAAFYFEGEQDTYNTVTPLFGGSEDVIYVESWQRRKDGEKRLLAWWCRALKDNGGNVIGALSTARDITERRRIEAALQESEKRYRLLAENLSDVIWTMDTNLRYTYMSPSVTSLRGYSVEEAMALSMEETTTPASLQTAMRVMAEAEAKEGVGSNSQSTSVTLELELICKDGSTIWVENRITYLRDAEGRLTGYQGVSRDISERRKAEKTVGESEARYRLLAENSSDVISVTDMNMRPVYMSPSVTALLGYGVEEAMALGLEAGLTPASLKSATEAFASVMVEEQKGQKQKLVTMDLEFIRKDGSTVWVATSVSFIRNSDGQPVEILTILHDISERKKAEEAIRESESRYRLLAENSSDVITVMDMNLRPVYMSPSITRLLGYSVEEAMAHGMEEGLTPASMKSAAEGFARVMAEEQRGQELKPITMDLEFRRKDGGMVWVVASVSFIRNSDGQAVEILSNLHDVTERKKAEETLRESEERLKILFDYAPDLYCLSTPEGTIVDANRFALELFGYQREEIVGKSFIESGVISLEQFEGGTASTTQKPGDALQMVLNRKDGTKVTVEIKTIPVTIKGQSMMLSIARDITERKKAEEALRQSEQKWKSIFDHTLDGLTIYDPESRRSVLANQALADIYGFSTVEKVLETDSMEHIPEEDREQVMREIAEDMAGGLKKVRDIRTRTEDGSVIWISVLPTMINYQGKPAVLLSIRDINDQKLAEEAVKESEKKYRLLAENASDVITVVGMDLKPKYMSPSTTRLLGYTVEEAMANGMENGLTPASFQVAAEAFGKAIAEEQKGQKQKPMTMDLEFKRKDGSTVWVANSVSFIRNSDGQAVEILSNLHDISERKKSEEELGEAKRQAEAANRAKSDFLANMSHEIRTPMNGVIGMAGLLSDTQLTLEQQDYVESIRSSADALLTVINDILDFSKVEAGKLTLEKIDFDLRSTLDNMSDVIGIRARDKGLEYVWLLEPNVPTQLVGDPGRLRQVLINLVGNGIKFTSRGSVDLRIGLVSETDDEAIIRFDIMDTGIGIANGKIDSLFKPFTQVDTSTTRRYGGTGLGLSISRQLVELMGGEVGAESTEGRGSTFWFTARVGKQSAQRVIEELPRTIAGLRILGVDDNPTNRKVLELMLQAWGCRVEVVENAALAMARLHAAVASGDPFRVAVIDMMMPDVNGETLGRMIKATPQLKDTVLIVSSSSGARDEAARLGAIGFAHYLNKPVKQSQLFDAIITSAVGESDKLAALASAPTAVSTSKPEQQKARVLLAEDNPVNQKVATAMLAKMGYYSDVVASGAEALKALEGMPYDLVLMDVHMPGMDGLEATRRIRDTESKVRNHLIPVIALTASAMKGDREMCLEAGMNDYISKPIDRGELARVLEQWAAPQGSKKTNQPEAEASQPAKVAEKTNPPEPKVTETAKVFDRSALLERVGGDGEICAEILKTFFEDVPERFKEMGEALTRGDVETLGRGAHTIKGSAGNVGAPILHEAAARLETAVAAGELVSAREKLNVVMAEFERFRKVAENH